MIKFKVNEDIIGPEYVIYKDIVYTIVDENKPEIEVGWIDPETGLKDSINYSNADMKKYFDNGVWIKYDTK